MIKFKNVKWKNLLSYGDFWTNVDLNTNSSTLVIGDNGAGKSTMIDAICYALYGKAFRKINTTQLINTINKKHMVVECDFQIGKHHYTVKRGLKPRLFEVWQDDRMLNQEASANDYQEILEKNILKLNHKSFTQIVVLGSSNFVPFMQLKSNDRREVIEDLLDIGIFTVMSSLLKDKISENKVLVSDTKHNKELVEQRIALMHEQVEKIQAQQDEDTAERVKEIEDNDAEISKLRLTLAQHSQKIENFEEAIGDQKQVEKNLREYSKVIDQLLDRSDRVTKEIEFFDNNDDCPTCKQALDVTHKHEHVTKKTEKIKELAEGIEQLRQKHDEKQKRLSAIEKINRKIMDEQTGLINTQSLLNSKLMYKNKLQDLISSVSDKQGSIEEEKKQIDILQLQVEELYTQWTEHVERQNVYEMGSKLLKDTGIKSRIIKQYVPVINKLIGKYLAAMDFFVQFELDEQFNETIKSRHRDVFSYESFSEGEKMRIDLALLFTWRAIAKLKNSASTNLLIMDEVFDSSLDVSGTDEFMKIIRDLASDTNVFIISHKTDMLVDRFTHVMRFEKHQNFSRIAE